MDLARPRCRGRAWATRSHPRIGLLREGKGERSKGRRRAGTVRERNSRPPTKNQNTDNNLSHAHLTTGQKATYTTSPPTGGPHNPTPLPAGVYAELSADPNVSPNIYQAVHSMEHGYVVVWYKALSSQQVDSLGQFGDDFKVIVAPYAQLPTGAVGLTAWGRLQTCQKVSTAQIAQFIKLYRLKTASEPQAP